MSRITLYTGVSPKECIERITSTTRTDLLSPDNSENGIMYNGRQETFLLYMERSSYSNSFSPIFVGKIYATSSDTVIQGRFRMRALTYLALAFFVIVLLMMTIMAVNPIPLLFIVFLVIISSIGRLLGQSDEEIIRNFLINTLEAKRRPVQGTKEI